MEIRESLANDKYLITARWSIILTITINDGALFFDCDRLDNVLRGGSIF